MWSYVFEGLKWKGPWSSITKSGWDVRYFDTWMIEIDGEKCIVLWWEMNDG